MIQNFKKASLTLVLLLIGLTSFAQGHTVSGKVTDAVTGEPLPGVAVLVKGTSHGVATEADGTYVLDVDPTSTLLCSCFGYADVEQVVKGRTNIDFSLSVDAQLLEETIVIGYGTTTKKDLTGAIGNIGGDAILSRKTNQVAAALQGSMPGVTVTRTNSAPGAQGTIRVRGITSMQDSSPLVIIDGATGSLSDVNPADVESLTVLKDAASAAIYGSRAAAGVILVTTKRGKYGEKATIDYSYSLSIDFPTTMPEYEDAVGYMKAQNEQMFNDNIAVGQYSVYTKETIDNYAQLHKQNPDAYPDTDWLGIILKKNALRHQHALSITTGGEKMRSKISLGFDDVDGLFKQHLSWNRFSIRSNNDIIIYNWLTATLDMNLRKTSSSNPYYSPSSTMRYMPPTFAAEWSDGRIGSGKEGINPYGRMMGGGTKKGEVWKAQVRAQLEIKPFDGLNITAAFMPDYTASMDKDFNKAVQYTPWNDPNGVAAYLQGTETTDLKEIRANYFSQTSQLFANYRVSFGKNNNHNITAMLGVENYYYRYEDIYASRGAFKFSYYPYLSMGSTELMSAGVERSPFENAYTSFFGRINYNYANKYYVQANFRTDGSARFAKGHRWGFFPSVSAGWILTEEGFMKGAKDVLSHLKIRASYGQLGNDRIGNYPYQSTLSSSNVLGYKGTSNTVEALQGFAAIQMVLDNITWETTETYDIGIDFNLFNDRLTFVGDYYKKITRDMLIKVDIPSYMGYKAPYKNVGDMYTNGWEFAIGWNDSIGDFTYGANFNLSDFKSMMGYIGDDYQLSGGKIIQSNTEYQAWYGYKSDGLYQTSAELTGSPSLAGSQPGDIKYLDISGAEGSPDGQITPTYDRTVLGGSLPRLCFGGNISLGWKGIDFSLSFQGVGKRTALLAEEAVQPLRTGWYNVPSFVAANHWSMSNTLDENKKAKYPRYSQKSGNNTMNYAVSDYWLINGSYFRIKDITLGYNLPKSWLKKIHVKNLLLSVSLSDFFTIDHFPVGWDPEVSSTGYPITKSLIFSASIKF